MGIMKNNICPICLKDSKFNYLESHVDNGLEYKLYECEKCRVQFWKPFKNPGAEWYEKDENYAGRNVDPDLRPNVNHKRILNYLKPFKGAVLDIGCGTGNFLYWAKKAGWKIAGFDFDRNAIKIAKDVFRLENIEKNNLTDYYKAHQNEKFDLITFFDFFEHIDNHNEFIEMVKSLLNKSSYIAASMPYRKMAKWLNPGDFPPRHLTRWDRRTLKEFLERRGFEVLYIKRKTEGLMPIFTRLMRRYAKFFSFNLVGKYKEKVRRENILIGGKIEKKINAIHGLAKIKNWLIFGLPTLIIWILMLPTSKRYVNLYVIAQEKI